MFKKILSACQGEIACRRAAVTTCRMLLGLCLVGAAASSMAQEEVLAKDMREEIVRIQVTVKDLYGRQETKPVPITIYRPEGEGPFPLLVFNHGRATSDLRAKQGRSRPEHLARYFTAKGFVVLAPTRIGYWETYGDFDPEDNRSCSDMRVEAMSTAASDQVLAAVEFAKTLPYVDASRWIVAGQSVGGLTSVTTVGRRPAGLLGGINFSGGTGGNPVQNPGRPCSPQQIGRYWGSLAKNAAVPIVTVIGLGIALLFGGAVITESVFAIPGLGRLTVDAILRRDYPIIQGVVLLFSFTYVLVNLCIDLLYTLFDPRIRY